MALSPIQIYQNSQSSVAQILQGGNQTVMSILDKAVQIGRDISNKQTAQERDLVGMRQQETALSQRRAENLQQDFEDTRRFARGIFESDRRADIDQAQEVRASARDVFSMGAQEQQLAQGDRRIELAEQELGMRREAFDWEQEGDKLALSNAEFERQQIGEILGSQTGSSGAASSVDDERRQLGQMKALYSRTRDPRLAGEIEVLEGRLSQSAAVAEETPASKRAQARFDMQKEKAAVDEQEKEIRMLVADTAAFTRQTPQVYKEGATKKDLAEATAYDKDSFLSEVNSAQNYTEEEYVNFDNMKLTPAQKEKRRKLWRYANKKSAAATSTPTESSSDWWDSEP